MVAKGPRAHEAPKVAEDDPKRIPIGLPGSLDDERDDDYVNDDGDDDGGDGAACWDLL